MVLPNVVVVHQLLVAFESGDLQTMFDLIDPDVELVEAREYPGATTRYGRTGVKDAFADWSQAWGQQRFEPEEFSESSDHVLVLGRPHVQGGATGVELDHPLAIHCTVRDGRITRAHYFLDIEEARAVFDSARSGKDKRTQSRRESPDAPADEP